MHTGSPLALGRANITNFLRPKCKMLLKTLLHWWGSPVDSEDDSKPDDNMLKWMKGLYEHSTEHGLTPAQLKELFEEGSMKKIKQILDDNEEERVRMYVEKYQEVLDREEEEGLKSAFSRVGLSKEGPLKETEVEEFYRLAERVKLAKKAKEEGAR
jgi:hypothetical protein